MRKSPFCIEHTDAFVQLWADQKRIRRQVNSASRSLQHEPRARRHFGPPLEPIKRATTDEERGTIYYLRVGDLIKIGYASWLAGRMKSYPPNTVLLATHEGTYSDEQRIHRGLRHLLAKGREWYRDCPEMQAVISNVLDKHGPPEPVESPPPTLRPTGVKPRGYVTGTGPIHT